MIVAKTLEEFIQARESLECQDSIGFVPTMGALHQGHISLVEHSVAKCRHTIVSIFVNPTQFNNPQDLATYPRTLEADCALLEANGVDIAFAPRVVDIYPVPDERVFNLGGLDSYGEGPRRPGHFNGVAQVVTRLFDIVKPQYAFFGEKDFQQVAIINLFCNSLNHLGRCHCCSIFNCLLKAFVDMRSSLSLCRGKEGVAGTLCKSVLLP